MLENNAKTIRRIDCNYAVCQSTYWMANCCINGYLVIYLTYRGFTDTQCGFTSSLCCFVAVFMQIFLSDLLDKHMELPIKNVMIALCCTSIACACVFGFLPLPIGAIILFYAAAHSASNCNNSFLNAQMMQFNNIGINSHYSWPRGVGSFVYAVTSFFLGVLIERYSAGVLSYIFIGSALLLVLAELFMPFPYKGMNKDQIQERLGKKVEHTSYVEMLRSNPVLMIFLLCVMLYSIGQTGAFMFQIRIVENLNGGTTEFGIAEFIRAAAELPALALAPVIYRKISIKKGLVLAMLFAAVKTWCMMLAPALGFVYAGSALNFLVTGLYIYASVVFVNQITRPAEKVRAQALTGLFYTIGSIIGNFCSGFLLDQTGLKTTFFICGLSCVAAGVILLLFCKLGESLKE